jgi:uncharacterized protein (TIGR03067 family)
MRASSLLCAAIALMLPNDAVAGDAAKADQRSLQGTWKVLAGNDSGKTLPPPRVKGAKMVVTGNAMKVYERDTQREMTFALEAAREPKTIDLTLSAGTDKGQLSRGIYALEGDTLKICFAPPGKARPVSFLPSQGSGEMLFVLKRVPR